jgi:hypothetical protein
MKERATAPDELVTEEEARATAQEALIDQGRLGDPASRHGGAYVFPYHPFAGGERARELENALVTVTPVDREHVRVQVAGVTVCPRARVRRPEKAE